MGYSPWHFWGLADANIVPVTSKCNDVIREYSWQAADEAGRADIRQKIMDAESLMLDNAGFYPAPVYSESIHPWPRFQDQRLYRMGRMDARGGFIPILLNEGQVRDCGIKAYTELADAAAITYTDQDGDGLAETFTCSAPTTITDPDEIAIYFQPSDRLFNDSSLSDRWRIEPVNVSFLMGTVTITGKRWLCVKPTLYEDRDHYPIDPTVNANFITHVMIYRRYTYTEGIDSNVDSQSALIWESKPCAWGCGCGATDGSTDPYSEGWVAGRCGIRNNDTGEVIPAEAVYDATALKWSHPCDCLNTCGEPDKVLIRYLAGYPLDSYGWMAKQYRALISRLAAAEMTRRICACDAANREWSNWQFDLARQDGPETYAVSDNVLMNPLGSRRGHVYAWSQFKSLARVTGMLA